MNYKNSPSVFIALITIFAAFNIVCDSLVVPPILPYSGVWYSWVFISEPITGIILGPLIGFFSNLVGVMAGHFINFIDVYEFIFTFGAPLGAMISAMVFRGKWKTPLAYYLVLLAGFFTVPVSWQLPFWGMWDVYLAFAVLLATVILTAKWKNMWNTNSKVRLIYILAASAFIGLEADVFFRIFVFVPCQAYRLFYGYDIGILQTIWAVGAVETPIKVALSTLVTVSTGAPILNAARKMGLPI